MGSYLIQLNWISALLFPLFCVPQFAELQIGQFSLFFFVHLLFGFLLLFSNP